MEMDSKEILIGGLLFIASFIILLLILEIGIRIIDPFPPSGAPEGLFSEQRGISGLTPGYQAVMVQKEFCNRISINPEGFRDDSYSLSKPQNTFRILMLGDSFQFGWGVEKPEIYSEIAEAKLNGIFEKKIEILSMGVPAVGTVHELKLLKEKGLAYRPDLVVLAYMVGNDLNDNINYKEYEDKEDSIESFPSAFSDVVNSMKSALKANTHIYWWVRQKTLYNPVMRLLFDRLNVLKMEPLVEYLQMNRSDNYQEGWNKTNTLILEAKDIAKKNGAGFLLVLIPSRIQVNHQEWDSVLHLYNWDKNAFDTEKPNSILIDFAESNGIDYLDLLPYFRQESQTQRLYYIYDGHWNKEGHALASEYLLNYIVSKIN